MKYLFSVLISTIILFLIFLGMAYITREPKKDDIINFDDSINVVFIKNKQQIKLKQKLNSAHAIVKPKQIEQSNTLKSKTISDINDNFIETIKNIERNHIFLKPAKNYPNFPISSYKDKTINPIGIKPLYPYDAYRNNVNGWVLVKLFISKSGKVYDVEVLDSKPKGTFENIAVKTAYKKYFPINKKNLDPKKYTKNLRIKFNKSNY